MQIKNAARNPLTNPRGHFIVVTLERISRENYAFPGPLSTLQESTAGTKRSTFRSATERAAHRLRGGFAGRRIEGSFRAGSLNISKRFRIAHVTGQENKVRWYRETFALLHTYAEGRFFDPRTTKKLKETHQWQRNWQRRCARQRPS